METLLDRSPEIFEAVLGASRDGVLITAMVETETQVFFANQRFRELFDISTDEELVGRPLEALLQRLGDAFVPDHGARLQTDFKRLEEACADAKMHNVELNLTDPTPRYLLLNVTPLPDCQVRKKVRIWSFHDITRVKANERELQVSRDKYRTLVNNIQEIVYSFNERGEFTFVNPVVEELLGFQVEELIGKKALETIIHPEDRANLEEFLQQALINCQGCETVSATMEQRLLTRTGEIRFFKMREIALIEDGKLISGQGIAIDITEEKKRTEEQRRYSESLEEKVKERTRNLEYANRQLSALNRISNEFQQIFSERELLDIIPQKLCEVLDFDRAILYMVDREGFPYIRSMHWPRDKELIPVYRQGFENLRREMKSGQLAPPEQFLDVLKKGKTVFISHVKGQMPEHIIDELHFNYDTKPIVITPIKVHGKVIGMIGGNLQYHARDMNQQDIEKLETFGNLVSVTIDNIRHHDELEELVAERTHELRETQAQLVQSEKMAALGGLVSGIAHEINNPIGAVNGTSDVSLRAIEMLMKQIDESTSLEELRANKRFNRSLKVLRENTQIAATASERIVEIVRSLKNFARLDEAEFQLANVHDGLNSTLTLIHHEIKNKIEIIKDYGEIPDIYCYPNQLNQVFMNVLVNASQAITENGRITIETRADQAHVIIRIIDNGRGIPAKNLNRIFDPGFTTKKSGVGTGLGLSISYNIVRKHHGTISAESEEGKGTTFTIKLPIVQESPSRKKY